MPVDYADPEFVYDPNAAFPGDLVICRDFAYGRHPHLGSTDHPIAEDAFPGAVLVEAGCSTPWSSTTSPSTAAAPG